MKAEELLEGSPSFCSFSIPRAHSPVHIAQTPWAFLGWGKKDFFPSQMSVIFVSDTLF